jgi:outer membrane protein assembly factor BamB
MNKGLYQLSYERIDVDRTAKEVRLSRRTEEHPAMSLLLTVPMAPSKEKRRVWNVDLSTVAAGVIRTEKISGAKQYRWDDHPWKALTDTGIPTEHLVEGRHRLTLRKDAQTYFAAGEITILPGAAKSGLHETWDRELSGGIMSHLRLDGETLFVSTMDGALVALRAEDGKPVWTARTEGYCHSSPLVLSDVVIVGSADMNVYAFDRHSGRQRWKFLTGGPVYASAAESGGIVAIGSGDGFIYGLDAKSGTRLWRYELPRSHTSFVQSPACTDGTLFYFGAWDKFVYALDVRTGELVWKHDCCRERAFAYSPAIGGPVVGGGKMVVPTDGNLLIAFGAHTGDVLWQVSAPGDKVGYSGPCLVGDRIYIGCLGDIGQARCFSAVDGKILWTTDIGSTIYDSSPSHADGVVAIGSVIGLLTAMDASDGRIIGQYQLPPGHFLASPVSAPGKIYAASYSNHVIAFDVRKEAAG